MKRFDNYQPGDAPTIFRIVLATVLLFPSLAWADNVSHTYDNLNRLIRTDYGNGQVIEYTYDAAGNRLSQMVKVTDTTPPVITCPADITGIVGQNVVLGTPTVTDNLDPTPKVTNNAPATFPPGLTTVRWTATDASGNSASCNQKVTLTYTFQGFFPPVDNPPVVNTVKNGSTVPVKWKLFDANGQVTDIATVATGYPKYATSASCPATGMATEKAIATGGTTLRFDTAAMQFIYNWKTPNKPGTCLRLDVKFIDGMTKSANFKLK